MLRESDRRERSATRRRREFPLDVVYRIDTCWWATVAGCYRAFVGLQLLFAPFVLAYPILLAGLLGHASLVAAVAGLSMLVQRRSMRRVARSESRH